MTDRRVPGRGRGQAPTFWVLALLSSAIEPLTRSHEVVLVTTPCFAEGAQREEYAAEDIDARIAARAAANKQQVSAGSRRVRTTGAIS